GGGHFSTFLRGYTWGNTGYGVGLTTGKAFFRLAFVNGIGLFPLWLVLAYAVATSSRHRGRLAWLAWAPLALTIVDIVVMRNYFGHHPPMAGPLLLLGIVFTISLLRCSQDTVENIPSLAVPIAALLCFLFGLSALAFFQANQKPLLSLV